MEALKFNIREDIMLEIWGRKYSSSVIPVMWTAGELSLPYVLHVSGGSFGGLDTPEFGRLNPNRQIPAIRDNGFPLWESHVIIRYLARKYGTGTLWPDDVQTAATADQWMEWCKSLAFPAVFPLFWDTVRTPIAKRNPALLAEKAAKAAEILAILEAHLANNRYVAGSTFSAGDIPLGAVIYRYFNVDVKRPPLPHIEAWYGRLTGRPAFQEHVMNFFGTNPEEWQELERLSGPQGAAKA